MKICYKPAKIISEIWSNTVIDWQPVDYTAVPPDQNFISLTHDPKSTSRHQLQTRYSFQAMECEETRCFKPFMVDWPVVFPERFIPPRVLYQHNFSVLLQWSYHVISSWVCFSKRILIRKQATQGKGRAIAPLDLYCESMKEMLWKDICPICDLY